MVRLSAPLVPTISTLRADLVPNRELAIRKWYSASPLWHYHQRGFPGDFRCDRALYQRIDPELRPICRLLHKAGIATTPSCQGHFHDRHHFQGVWDALEREESLIRSRGLIVQDSTTGREYLFRAGTYQLPWSSFPQFYEQVALQQSEGCLGILVPRDRVSVVCQMHNRPFRTGRAFIRFDGDLSCILGGSLFAATVQSRDPGDCTAQWKAVADYLREVVNATPERRRNVLSRVADHLAVS